MAGGLEVPVNSVRAAWRYCLQREAVRALSGSAGQSDPRKCSSSVPSCLPPLFLFAPFLPGKTLICEGHQATSEAPW